MPNPLPEASHPMLEVWKQIDDFPDYFVSDLGRVASNFWGLMKPSGKNYPHVVLRKDGKSSTKEIHSLVCSTFHGPAPSATHEVAHWNGDKTCNFASNLRWATRIENRQDGHRLGEILFGESVGNSVLTTNRVLEIRALYSEAGKTFAQISRLLKINDQTVADVCNRKTWRHI